MRLEYPHEPGWLARIAAVIAEQGGAVGAIDLVHIRRGLSVRDYTVEAGTAEQAHEIIEAVKTVDGVKVHFVSDNTFHMHVGGKLEIASRVALKTRADLAMAYTPGVARVCTAIHEKPALSFNLTVRKNMVAVISDGSAVLGLGDIGPEAAMPVMEGKAILFKEFGGVDAFPLCINESAPDRIIAFCRQVAPTFGGINLEDIKAPQCFYIEETLRKELDIPVFHDDQHGTAVVLLAGIINALKLQERGPEGLKLVVSGAGAAGVACTKILVAFGFSNIVVCDSKGAIHAGRDFPEELSKQWLVSHTNPGGETGSLKDVIAGADVFVGVSRPDVLDRADVERMNEGRLIFAMSNPDPEVRPEDVHDIVAVMGTGRSDYPNQINNVLAFPGIFRGALDVHASDINEEMKLAAAHAIAGVITDEERSPEYIIPSAFNRTVSQRVARAVAKAARETKVARRTPKVDRLIH